MIPGRAAVSRQPSAVSPSGANAQRPTPNAQRWPARGSGLGARGSLGVESPCASCASCGHPGSGLAARASRLSVLGPRFSRGFTLIEILIVITIIGILITLAQPSYNRAVLAAKEATLKENLFILRDVIDQYYADNMKYPESLTELVDRGYIRRLPKDPVTGSVDTWQIVSATDEQGQPVGIYDVRSGAEREALDGSKYSDW